VSAIAVEEPVAGEAAQDETGEEEAEEEAEQPVSAIAVEEPVAGEAAWDETGEEAAEEPAEEESVWGTGLAVQEDEGPTEEETAAEEAVEPESESEEAIAEEPVAEEEAEEEEAVEGEAQYVMPEAGPVEDEDTGEAVADEAVEEEEEIAWEAPAWAVSEVGPVSEEVAAEEEAEEAAAGTTPVQPAAEDTSELPLTPVRRIIAEHMARSSREIPAAWAMVETDVTRMVRARDALRAAFEQEHGIPLTYLPFAASAVAAALREHPRLNARWDDGHITLNNRVNIAVAVATQAGLMVPVVRDADTLSIADIAAELRRLSDGARAGTLGIEDVQGGTFTLNNTGALGSVVSVPIINHPQAAIMTTEAIVKRPVVVEGDAIAVRSMMNLCLTFDHRVCDGAEAAAFLSAVKARLQVIDESIGLG